MKEHGEWIGLTEHFPTQIAQVYKDEMCMCVCRGTLLFISEFHKRKPSATIITLLKYREIFTP